MPELRWILLLVGVGVIAGVFLWQRRSASAAENNEVPPGDRTEPSISEPIAIIPEAAPENPAVQAPVEAEPPSPDPVVEARDPEPQALNLEPPDESDDKNRRDHKIISLRIATRSNISLNGVEVVNALNKCGLEYGQYRIFHRFSQGDQRELLFSVASLVEPGSFDLDALDNMNLPGLSVFMILPGPTDAVKAFSDMLVVSRRLAEKLNCELLDDTGSTLSAQAASYLREDIIKFQHQLGTQT